MQTPFINTTEIIKTNNEYFLNKLTINFLIKIDFYKNFNSLNSETKINSLFFGKFNKYYLYNIQKIIWFLKFFFFNLINFFKQRSNIILINNIKLKNFIHLIENLFIFKTKTKFNNFVNFISLIDNNWYNGIISNWRVIFALISKVFFNQKTYKTKYLKLKKIFNKLKLRNFSSPIPDAIILIDQNKKGLKESLKSNLPLLGFIDNKINPNYFLYYTLGNLKNLNSLIFLLNILELSVIKSIYIEQKIFKILILNKILQKF